MSTLQENLDAIKLDKDTNLKPENLKAGVTCLGVNGVYEGSGGAIKQFATIEEMNNSTGNEEGDLAVVYRSEIQNATVDSRFQIATFPDTVVLDSAITDYVDIRYRAVDSSKMFDCMGSLDSSSFRMDCYTDSGEIRIQYTSEDGITYTRTDTTGNPIDFGTEIYYERPEYWNDAIGKFIQVSGSTFEGLFEYSSYKDKTKIKLPLMSGLNIQYDSSSSTISSIAFNKEFSNEINFTKLVSVYNKFISDTSTPNNAYIYLDNNNNLKFVQNCNMLCYDKNVNFLGVSVTISTDTDTTAKIYNIDLENETYTLDTELEPSGYIYGNSNYNWNYYNLNNKTIPFNIVNSKPANFNHICIGDTTSSKTSYTKYIEDNDCYIDTSSYLIAPTQLIATSDYVYEKEFYGQNGVETGILVQDVSNSFADVNAEIYSKIQNQYENMEPRILTDDDKTIDKNIYFIPVKKDGTPLLDTNSVTNMQHMFSECTNMTTIPLLDTSSATDMQYMFNGCTNLTTIPLLDTSKATSMTGMFMNCTNLIEIPLLNTSNVTNMNSMFSRCTSLTAIPLLNTSNVTNMNSMFEYCTSLTTMPLLDTSNVTNTSFMFYNCTNLTEIPLLNTSNDTDMYYMFYGCTSLQTIPSLDTSKVTNMRYMFYGCTSLSDESLNNILAMCANATSYTGTKTLKFISLTSEQAAKCTTLSNYSAFTAAGWTTGY